MDGFDELGEWHGSMDELGEWLEENTERVETVSYTHLTLPTILLV